MEFSEYLEGVRQDGVRLAAVAGLGLTADVPSCPGWTVADVVAHTGAVHRQKERIVRERIVDEPPEGEPGPEDGLIEWYVEGLDALVATLGGAGPDEVVWTWHDDDQTSGFWGRRMAHETMIHRIDVELAHQVVTSMDPELACDGIDEILSVMMTGHPGWAEVAPTDRTVRIRAHERDASWGLRLVLFSGTSTVTGNSYQDEPTLVFEDISEPGTSVSGTGEELDRFLWGRGPADHLGVVGDHGMLDVLRDIAVDVTQ